ncbi:acyltransferase family protein [Limnofasciculus baicalensis]|uniref:Acyltransferase n=1 Tax=Limnofasciculus baicalensis BBK-W-15 TaxID=2699891 RepID=A0AAE3GTX7_9CYAN|nr:acyltransferase [Limnofasciculus baicalensis]MCP2730429.1 acyltransferase [Limnofasciculus baicalensis BBK-W-15]
MSKPLHLNKLDAIRGFAAMYVLLYHLVSHLDFIPKSIKTIFFSFGQEAVMLFFLLSGFVIYLSIYKNPHITFKSYFIKRFRRIYSPFIVSILLAIAIAYFNGNLLKSFSWSELAGNLLMLQDFAEVKPGNWVNPFMDNLPLWSLSYEWWFYMMFYPIYKGLGKTPYCIYFVLGLSVIAYGSYLLVPNHASFVVSYFIIWWSGVEAARVFIRDGRFTYRNIQPIFFSLLFMTVVTAIPILHEAKIRLGYFPFLTFRHFCISLLAVGIGLVWYRQKLFWFDNMLGWFTHVAPISYAVYIMHYPILMQLNLSSYIPNLAITLVIKLALTFGLSYLTEIKLQPLVNSWIK